LDSISNQSALEEDRKVMEFDLKGWLLPLANVRPEINGLMHGQTNKVNVVISMYN
jgi:hypothetical protein